MSKVFQNAFGCKVCSELANATSITLNQMEDCRAKQYASFSKHQARYACLLLLAEYQEKLHGQA